MKTFEEFKRLFVRMRAGKLGKDWHRVITSVPAKDREGRFVFIYITRYTFAYAFPVDADGKVTARRDRGVKVTVPSPWAVLLDKTQNIEYRFMSRFKNLEGVLKAIQVLGVPVIRFSDSGGPQIPITVPDGYVIA